MIGNSITSKYKILAVSVLAVLLQSCASYHIGNAARTVPGGFKKITVPIFRNKTQETGIEVAFTKSLMTEFQRSHVAEVVPESLGEARIEGVISNLQYISSGKKQSGDTSAPYLPTGTVIASEYGIQVTVEVTVKRAVDGTVLWTGSFSGERTYSAPLVTIAGVNSVNPLYNLSARRQNIELIANSLMAEAHDRLTENF